MSTVRTGLLFDMRAPDFGAGVSDLYRAALDMSAFGDEIGVDFINLMEHHASKDGYLPAPFVLGGAIASRTTRCDITLGAVVLPLHDPIKVAEQIAVLDIISRGRLNVIFAAGYVLPEFQMFGVSLSDRARLMDLGLDIIVRALGGERFVVDGREIFIRPLPVQSPQDIIMVGGGVEAAARRAARFGVGFSPMRPGLFELYDAECRKLGREPGRKNGGHRSAISIFLTEDPELEWRRLMPHMKHVIREYARWADEDPRVQSPFSGLVDDSAAIRRSGMFLVLTPDELVAKAPDLVGPHGYLGFMPLLGGLDPKIGWQSLELLKQTMPRLKAINNIAKEP